MQTLLLLPLLAACSDDSGSPDAGAPGLDAARQPVPADATADTGQSVVGSSEAGAMHADAGPADATTGDAAGDASPATPVDPCADSVPAVGAPVEQWGSTRDDRAYGMAVAGDGSVWVTGFMADVTEGQPGVPPVDAFVARYCSDGTLAWMEQFGSADDDRGRDVAVDAAGNGYVTGWTDGALADGVNAGLNDVFVTAWRLDGMRLWTTQVGTADDDYGFAIAATPEGTSYVTGQTGGDLSGQTSFGFDDVFVMRLDREGTVEWTRLLGTRSNEAGAAVEVGIEGDLFVAGNTFGDLEDGPGGSDSFLSRWTPAGDLTWVRQWGAPFNDAGKGVALDGAGNVYVAGFASAAIAGDAGVNDVGIFLTKWSEAGVHQWDRQWGAASMDGANAVTVSAAGEVLVVGRTLSDLHGEVNAGSGDIFLTRWNADGDALGTQLFGTLEDQEAWAVDTRGDLVFIAGMSRGTLGLEAVGSADAVLLRVELP